MRVLDTCRQTLRRRSSRQEPRPVGSSDGPARLLDRQTVKLRTENGRRCRYGSGSQRAGHNPEKFGR